MPAALERALQKAARKKGYSGERAGNFVYGTMTNMGWRRGKPGLDKSKAKKRSR